MNTHRLCRFWSEFGGELFLCFAPGQATRLPVVVESGSANAVVAAYRLLSVKEPGRG
jgi:hypothetical protein